MSESQNTPIDLSSAKAVRAQKRKARNSEEQFEKDLDVVLSSTQGRRFLWHMLEGGGLEGAGVFQDPFSPVSESITAYRAGRQSMGKFILAKLMTPRRMEYYQQMIEETATDG
jgi:hypothetical protein